MAIRSRTGRQPLHASLQVLDATGRSFDIGTGQTLLGTGPGVDIVLSDSSVGRRRAIIECRGEDFYIRNYRPKNGSYVNGKRMYSEQRLSDGDVIQLADMKLRFHEAGHQPSAASLNSDVSANSGTSAPAIRSPIPDDVIAAVVGSGLPQRRPLVAAHLVNKVQGLILRLTSVRSKDGTWSLRRFFSLVATVIIFILLTRRLRIQTSGMREVAAVGLAVVLSLAVSIVMFRLLSHSRRLIRLLYGDWEFGKLPFIRTRIFRLMLALHGQFDVKFSKDDAELLDEFRSLHGDVFREVAATSFIKELQQAGISTTAAKNTWADVWKYRILERRWRDKSFGESFSKSYVWQFMPSVLQGAQALMAPFAVIAGLIMLFVDTHRSGGNILPGLEVILISGVLDFRSYAVASSQASLTAWISAGVGSVG
jgi:pSer/pThr/pTyr-binding forkhead associated (FHA) protein